MADFRQQGIYPNIPIAYINQLIPGRSGLPDTEAEFRRYYRKWALAHKQQLGDNDPEAVAVNEAFSDTIQYHYRKQEPPKHQPSPVVTSSSYPSWLPSALLFASVLGFTTFKLSSPRQ